MVVGVRGPPAGTRRSISSQVPLPTSPTKISPVPGRNASRNGFRSPWATMRLAFGSELVASGLPVDASPVAGSTRMIAPSRPTGSAVVRRSWERSMPPSAVGASTVGGSPCRGRPRHRITAWVDGRDRGCRRWEGAAALAVVHAVEAGPVTTREIELAVGADHQPAAAVAGELLAPVLQEERSRCRMECCVQRDAAPAGRSPRSRRPFRREGWGRCRSTPVPCPRGARHRRSRCRWCDWSRTADRWQGRGAPGPSSCSPRTGCRGRCPPSCP